MAAAICFSNQIITASAIDFLYLQRESHSSIAAHPAGLSPFGEPFRNEFTLERRKKPAERFKRIILKNERMPD
jgi:hypothetical protein